MPDNPMCETCRFWKENPYYQEGENSPGWCRRYAPRPRVLMYDDDSTDTSMTEIMWPVVSDGDWCGEHAPRHVVVTRTEPVFTMYPPKESPDASV